MPGMDKTGPLGTGTIGRGMGPCGGGEAAQRGGRMGMGRGRGFRQGGQFGWEMTPTPLSPDEEKGMLEQQKSLLEKQLTAITQRQQELKENKSKVLDEPMYKGY
jgi:hypothetical protein